MEYKVTVKYRLCVRASGKTEGKSTKGCRWLGPTLELSEIKSSIRWKILEVTLQPVTSVLQLRYIIIHLWSLKRKLGPHI